MPRKAKTQELSPQVVERAKILQDKIKKLPKCADEFEYGYTVGEGERPDLIERVRFHFPKKVWADLANKEGELLPACCSSISRIRDELIGAMRDDGWLSADEMQTIVVNSCCHGDTAENHPINRVKQVYEALEGHLKFGRRSMLTADPDSLDDAEDNFLYEGIQKWVNLRSNKLFGEYGSTPYEQAEVNKALFETIPVVRTLANRIQEAGFPPVEGYALVRRADGKICEQRRGMAIYPTMKEAEQILGYWVKSEQVRAEDVEIRAARVSWEKGVEILEAVENAWTLPRPVPEITETQHNALFRGLNALRDKVPNDRVDAILREAIGKIQEIPYGGSGPEPENNGWDDEID